MRKDINFNFTAHPLTGDLSTKTGDSAVRQSLKNIILSVFYSRGYNVEFGTSIEQNIFEINVPGVTEQGIREQIINAVEEFEPGVELLEVKVDGSSEQGSAIDIEIYYNIVNENIDRTLTMRV